MGTTIKMSNTPPLAPDFTLDVPGVFAPSHGCIAPVQITPSAETGVERAEGVGGDWFPDVGIRRHANIGGKSSVCFQRQIRDRINAETPHEPIASLDGAQVVEIPPEKARPIIYKYEWLGTMGRSVHCCGLMLGGELLGVACFGWPAGPESRDICGKENRNLAICLERGACVHYAPKNAGSFLVANACKVIAKNHDYRIFYAYSDEDAGEIGTIYQACNWLYIGQGVGRTPGRLREYYLLPDGKVVSCRTLRHRGMTKTQALAEGWQVRHQKPKHKYVWVEASRSEKKKLMRQLRYPAMAYPKRDSSGPPGGGGGVLVGEKPSPTEKQYNKHICD